MKPEVEVVESFTWEVSNEMVSFPVKVSMGVVSFSESFSLGLESFSKFCTVVVSSFVASLTGGVSVGELVTRDDESLSEDSVSTLVMLGGTAESSVWPLDDVIDEVVLSALSDMTELGANSTSLRDSASREATYNHVDSLGVAL